MTAAWLLALSTSIQALIGQPVPDWPPKTADEWVQGGPLTLSELRGRVVLVRFFTDPECPYCRATAPALNELHAEFASSGLVVIGIYTPKPRPRPVDAQAVRAVAALYGFRFPVAIDAGWGALRRLWLDRVPGAEYTSSSLLIDRDGILRHVQRGGAYAKDAPDEQGRRDYREMRSAVETLVGGGVTRPK